jgi:hypothetical protein
MPEHQQACCGRLGRAVLEEDASQDGREITAAVDFAREHNLRLVVKGGLLQRLFYFWFDMASPWFQAGWVMISPQFRWIELAWFRKPAIEYMRRIAQAC